MNQQVEERLEVRAERGPIRLLAPLPWHVRAVPGRLDVQSGRVWVTRPRDLDDHVLAAGESLVLADLREVVVEAWDAATPALVSWRVLHAASPAVAPTAWRFAAAG